MASTRREFLTRTGAIGCSLAASPFVTPVVLAAAPGEARLVVIILRGGMDGLDVVRPVGDPDFAGLGRGGPAGLALDGFYELHPALSGLHPLWQKEELAFAHAVSTPYRDKRSHFDGQDFLENGGGAPDGTLIRAGDGWLNRLLPHLGNATAETAFAVGRERLLLLTGAAPHSSWSPDADLDLSPQANLLLDLIYERDPLFHKAAQQAALLSSETEDTMRAGKAGRAEALASYAASRLAGDTRIAAFSLSGWDTHKEQGVTLPRALGELETAILTLKSGLGPAWATTTVMALTEFGRTARINGNKGTDHGTGGAIVLAGGAVRGGRVFGDWPGLGEADLYDRRDLLPTNDLRRFVGWTMRGLFGVERGVLERDIFPGLDLGGDPRVTA